MKKLAISVLLMLTAAAVYAEELGDVKTAFRFTGSDKIVVEVFDDPLVEGIACFVSRAKTGGISGALGLAEDKTEASIACRQISDIRFKKQVPVQDDVFTERMSALFKKFHVVRIVDPKRNSLVYLTYSDKLVDGSPKNSITAVPVPAALRIPLRR